MAKTLSERAKSFNDYRFAGLAWRKETNKYLTMHRVNEDESKIVVKVARYPHIRPTQYGYALVLDDEHCVYLKSWQVDEKSMANEFDNIEVVLDKKFFNVREAHYTNDIGINEENYEWNSWVEIAKTQDTMRDDESCLEITPVRWAY